MTARDILLTVAATLTAVLLLTASAVSDLRDPDGTADLAATLAEDPAVREAASDALIDALLADSVERSPVVGGLLPLIRPLLVEAARTAVDSPAGRAALTSALTDTLRQLTYAGPTVVDLRAAALLAAETAPPPLDTLARTAVEQGQVGLVVLGGTEEADATDVREQDVLSPPPTEAELLQIAGLPAGVAIGLVALTLGALLLVLVGRDATRRPRRLVLAGVALLIAGASGVLLLRLAPELLVERMAMVAAGEPDLVAVLLPAVVEGLFAMLERTSLLAGVLAIAGVALSGAGTLVAAGRRRRT